MTYNIRREFQIMKMFFAVFLLVVFTSFSLYAEAPQVKTAELPPTTANEEQNSWIRAAVSGMVKSHKYKVGIFRILPTLSANTGYDSDAVFIQDDFVGDYYFSAAPAAAVGVKLGNRAYVELIERLTFLYYKELDQRRDIYNSTRGRFVTGSSRMLATVEGGYYRRNAPVDEEFDVPVEHSISDGGINLAYGLSSRMNLNGDFRVSQSEYEAQEDLNQFIPKPLNRRTYSLGTGMFYSLRDNLRLTADVNVGRSTSLETDIHTTTWGLFGGLGITGRKLAGDLRLGFGQGRSQDRNTRNTVLVAATVDVRVKPRWLIGASLTRHQTFSDFVDTGIRVTTAAGVHSTVQLVKRLSVSGSFTIGRNDYEDDLILNGVVIEEDNYYRSQLTVGYAIIRNLTLSAGALYYNRDTDISVFRRDRLTFIIGLGYSTTL
jgi:hypothetical protein